MKKQELFDAINTMAIELGHQYHIRVDNEVFAPMSMTNLAASAWVQNMAETKSSKIVKEQLNNLWYQGALKFGD